MKRLLGWCLLVVLLAACSSKPAKPAPTPASQVGTATPAPQAAQGSLTANGVLQPARRLELSFGAAGFVETVAVQAGESVKAGQALARLSSAEAQLAVKRAQEKLETAQAAYRRVAPGLEAQQKTVNLELLAAQHDLSLLHENAGLDQAAALQEVVQANKAVQQAEYDLYQFITPSTLAGLNSLQALELAKGNLDRARANFAPYLSASEEAEPRRALKEKLDQAQGDYNAAIRRLELEAACQAARARLEKARQGYATLLNGPDPAKVALAEALVASKQAQSALIQAGGTVSEQLALAQAQVEAARLELENAQALREGTAITAPFDGVIAAVHLGEGEWAEPGTAAIALLDTSSWRVETKNIGELQVGRVKAGQEALVWVNAFRTERLKGRVVTISPEAVVQQGDTTYTVLIALEPTALNLRPGMTAQVEVRAGSEP